MRRRRPGALNRLLARAHLEDGTFAAGGHAECGLEALHGVREQAVQRVVVVGGVVVEQDHLLRAHVRRELEGVAVGAVAPPDAARVFRVGELGVVDQEIGAGRELVAGGPLRLAPLAIAKAERGLVVGQIDGAAALLLDPVTHGGVRVTDERRPDAERTDLEGGPWHLVTGDVGQIAQVHGEQRRREIA